MNFLPQPKGVATVLADLRDSKPCSPSAPLVRGGGVRSGSPLRRLRCTLRRAVLLAAIATAVSAVYAPSAALADGAITIAPKDWRVVQRESGPVNYYRVVNDPTGAFVRGEYKPGLATTVLGFQVPDNDRSRVRTLRWRWRAVTLPQNGDGCSSGRRDSAATVYVTWKRGLRWYTLKYVWTTTGAKGSSCDRKRNPFVAQDTVILQSGDPNEWRLESLDLRDEFRKHFENGDPNADVPDFQGIGIMTDGDDTKSESSADYAGFSVGF